jgi:hypothetical protein
MSLLSYELCTILMKWEVRTKKYVRKLMPKRYTPVTAAADVEKALRLLEGRWKLVILFHLFGDKVMRFSDLDRTFGGTCGYDVRRTMPSPSLRQTVFYVLALDAILKWADRRPTHKSR